MPDFIASNGGQVPSSLDEMRDFLHETISEEIELDARSNRILPRAVLFRDVSGADGFEYKWLIAVVLPRFDTIDRHLICYGGEYWKDGREYLDAPGCVTAEQVERKFGEDVVKAVIRQNQLDTEHRAGSAAPAR